MASIPLAERRPEISMRTSLIITTYNRPNALRSVLHSLARQRVFPDETIIVDDGSTKETHLLIREFAGDIPNLTHVWHPHDGFRVSRARNLGIGLARNEYLIFADGDMVLHDYFVKDHIQCARKDHFVQGPRIFLDRTLSDAVMAGEAEVSLLSRGVSKRRDMLRSRFLSRLRSRRLRHKTLYVQSCNQSFWKSDLVEANGFDEFFYGYGGEDTDLARRLLMHGIAEYRVRHLAIAYHLHHPVTQNYSITMIRKSPEIRCAEGLRECMEATDAEVNRYGITLAEQRLDSFRRESERKSCCEHSISDPYQRTRNQCSQLRLRALQRNTAWQQVHRDRFGDELPTGGETILREIPDSLL